MSSFVPSSTAKGPPGRKQAGRLTPGSGLLTLVQDSIGRLVPSEGLLGQVLVALGKALHLSQAGVEGHGWVVGVLGHVEVRGPPELLLNDQRLLQQLGEGRRGAERRPSPFSWAPAQAEALSRKERGHVPTQKSS